jgi:predicted kinase
LLFLSIKPQGEWKRVLTLLLMYVKQRVRLKGFDLFEAHPSFERRIENLKRAAERYGLSTEPLDVGKIMKQEELRESAEVPLGRA